MRAIFKVGFAVFLIGVTGCKKEQTATLPQGSFFISFKADGVQRDFRNQAVAVSTLPDTSGIYSSLLASYESDGGTDKVHISLLLVSRNSHNRPSTFQDPLKVITNGGNLVPQVIITYWDSQGSDGYQSLGSISDFIGSPGSLFPNLYADGKVVITEAAGTFFKGTFSGSVYKGDLLGTKKVITEGKFYLPRY